MFRRVRKWVVWLALSCLFIACTGDETSGREDASWVIGDRDVAVASDGGAADVAIDSDALFDATDADGSDVGDVRDAPSSDVSDATDVVEDAGPFELPGATTYFPRVFAQYYHSCVLGSDGDVECFGLGSDPLRDEGELDYDQALDAEGDFVQIAGGFGHTCALRRDGSLHCWGAGSEPISDNPHTRNYEQALDREGPFLGVTADGLRTCVLDADKHVECWGNTVAQSPFVGTFEHVSTGWAHTCAIRTDGTLFCTGIGEDPDRDFHDWDFNQAVPPDGRFAQVSAGALHTCALRRDATAECWGLGSDPNVDEGPDDFGQAQPPAGQFEWISAGVIDTCGVRPSGEIECWGFGATVDEDDAGSQGQADPPPGPFIEVSMGTFHACGLRPDHTFECWGWNGLGQTDPDSEFAADGCRRVDYADYGFYECSPLCQRGCQADEACRLEKNDDGGRNTRCRPAGVDDEGEPCMENSCMPGLLCMDEGGTSVCRQLCRRFDWGAPNCPAQYQCTGGFSVGVCEPVE